MLAVFRREFRSYFRGIKGYLFLAIYAAILGYTHINLVFSGATKIYSSLTGIVIPTMLLIPLITATSYADDRRFNTRQYLHSSPIYRSSWVLGKFFASMLIYLLAILPAFLHTIVLNSHITVRWLYMISSFLGLIALSAALIAIGQFSSMLVNHPLKGALIYYGLMFVILTIDLTAVDTRNTMYHELAGYFSFSKRYRTFPAGLFSLTNIFFYLGITTLFLYLITRILEHRRWREKSL